MSRVIATVLAALATLGCARSRGRASVEAAQKDSAPRLLFLRGSEETPFFCPELATDRAGNLFGMGHVARPIALGGRVHPAASLVVVGFARVGGIRWSF